MSVERIEGLGYPILAGRGLLEDDLPEFIAGIDHSNVAVITNETVGPLYGAALADRLPSSTLISVPDGEHYKTLDTVRTLYDALLEFGADRSTLIVALGGGVIGDMAGFAAATFMRGVRFIQAPTSLLAMVDASIGGKVGVDLPQGKNLVGAFYDPLAVFADTRTLETLPEVEKQNGYAEIIKSGLVGDVELLEKMDAGRPPVEEMIVRAVSVKVAVVKEDRLEGGIRAYLNLGHTFGHALEQVSGYEWKHGHAVAVGIAAAARLSERLEIVEEPLSADLDRLMAKWDLPTRFDGYQPEQLWEAMRHDKKWKGGAARFVLLRRKGEPVVVPDVAQVDVLAALSEVTDVTH